VVADFYLRAHVNEKPAYSIPLWSRTNCEAMRKANVKFCSANNIWFLNRSIEENWVAFEIQYDGEECS
jgi:hypothetical protein